MQRVKAILMFPDKFNVLYDSDFELRYLLPLFSNMWDILTPLRSLIHRRWHAP